MVNQKLGAMQDEIAAWVPLSLSTSLAP